MVPVILAGNRFGYDVVEPVTGRPELNAVMTEVPKLRLTKRRNSDAARWDEMWEVVLRTPPMPNEMHRDREDAPAAYSRYRWAKPRDAKVFTWNNFTLPDEPERTWNYRFLDLLLLTRDRSGVRRVAHLAGATLVVGDVDSPGDETHEKLAFHATPGAPEVWAFDRDPRTTEVRVLDGGSYLLRIADPDGWLRSPSTEVEFRQDRVGKIWARAAGDAAPAEELPDD